jgi:hypothetical protein
MYKKRFAKWGFQKNSKRSVATLPDASQTTGESRSVTSKEASLPGELSSVPKIIELNHRDSLTLMSLTNVRTWSVAFFESAQFRNGSLASQQRSPHVTTGQPQPSDVKKINWTSKLVSDLLDRGRGDMAGRMARKAFLLVEDMLSLEGPALLWNLLEMMHHMVTLRHAQLFHMLLAHLVALADGQKPEAHPLPAILRGLRGLIASLTSTRSTSHSSPPSSSSLILAKEGSCDEKMTTVSPCLLSHALSSLLEQAWVINAEILFQRFDPRLFHLYFRLIWESCSIGPPIAIIGATKQWFGQIDAQPMLSATTVAHHEERLPATTSIDEENMTTGLLTPRMDASPPRDYEMLRSSSIATLRQSLDSILSERHDFSGDTTVLLRMLAGLGTAKLLERSPATDKSTGAANNVTKTLPRFHAGNVACLIRTLVSLNTEQSSGDFGASCDAIERLRTIVTLCAYAEGETYPQVVRDMWLLQDALAAAGEYVEAREVERDAYRRIEIYIQDIPAHLA